MSEIFTPSYSRLFWSFSQPPNDQDHALVIVISDWIYGLIPYCGPGTRNDIWKRERIFQGEVCRFLNQLGIATLSMDTTLYENTPPSEKDLVEISSEGEIIASIRQLIEETGCSLEKTVIFGHGFGTRLLSKIAAFGIRPAGYILAAGLYSDTDAIISQKYLPFNHSGSNTFVSQINDLDPETDLILKHFGKVLYASRKGKEKIRLEEAQLRLELILPKELFSFETSSAFLLSHINAPVLLIHGSCDLDIQVSNVFFLEQKLKQKYLLVSRIILLDCDHWFREMPSDSEERLKERLTGECIHHKMDNRFFKNIQIFIEDLLNIKTSRGFPTLNIPEENEGVSSM